MLKTLHQKEWLLREIDHGDAEWKRLAKQDYTPYIQPVADLINVGCPPSRSRWKDCYRDYGYAQQFYRDYVKRPTAAVD